jgi:hypothetical protein
MITLVALTEVVISVLLTAAVLVMTVPTLKLLLTVTRKVTVMRWSGQAVHATHSVFFHFDKGQLAGRRVAAEDGHRVVSKAGSVEVLAIRTDRHRVGPR